MVWPYTVSGFFTAWSRTGSDTSRPNTEIELTMKNLRTRCATQASSSAWVEPKFTWKPRTGFSSHGPASIAPRWKTPSGREVIIARYTSAAVARSPRT